ncbi:MAG: hypothetical protein SFW07_08240 [Gammaproteobacteria bacterium]|nr:hypothetical protein [Gammaproteobacteria bacterium]
MAAFSATMFVSNNTQEITVQSAYVRLTGQPQANLRNTVKSILDKYQLTSNKSDSILGVYRMSTDKDMTADNTEYVSENSSQPLSDKKIFSIAKALAITLHQDSVAVFILDQNAVGDVSVHFMSHKPGINEVINDVHKNLPALYSQGFSLHLVNTCCGFDHARVSEVEWLGSKINLTQIKRAFPAQHIVSQDGVVYLIYQNGKQEKL